MLLTLVVFVLVFSLIIFVHELGHFLTARKLGIAVEEFGFGFPPRLTGVRRGGVLYSINLIPFGGFVRMKGEDGSQADVPDSFSAKPALHRAAVLVAGVTMNVILAMVLLMFSFGIGIPSVVDDATTGTIREQHVQILGVQENSPAAEGGLAEGDVITSINDTAISHVTDVQTLLGDNADTSVKLTIDRDGVSEDITVTPRILNPDAGQAQIGVSLITTGIVSYPWYQAIWQGITRTGELIWEIMKGFGLLIHDLVVTRHVSNDVAGPLGIAVLTGQVTKLGFIYVLQFIIVLSLTLAVMNLVPFPALDGGRLLFVGIEKLRGRPVSRKVENLVHGIGFYLLIILLIVISVRDFNRYSIAERIGSFFQNIF